jgi:hypothetical protein
VEQEIYAHAPKRRTAYIKSLLEIKINQKYYENESIGFNPNQ